MTSSGPSVVVLDHGSGNLRSAERALTRAGALTTVTGDRAAAMDADGSGRARRGRLRRLHGGLRDVRAGEVVDRRLAGGRAVLGICVGMQVMFDEGLEHGVRTEGLGEWPGVVERLQAPVLPHMGWNTVKVRRRAAALFEGVEDERFYFVHSYAVRQLGPARVRTSSPRRCVTWSEHGEPFVAAVENGPLSATQFHPEKSGDAGARLLRNWVAAL